MAVVRSERGEDKEDNKGKADIRERIKGQRADIKAD